MAGSLCGDVPNRDFVRKDSTVEHLGSGDFGHLAAPIRRNGNGNGFQASTVLGDDNFYAVLSKIFGGVSAGWRRPCRGRVFA